MHRPLLWVWLAFGDFVFTQSVATGVSISCAHVFLNFVQGVRLLTLLPLFVLVHAVLFAVIRTQQQYPGPFYQLIGKGARSLTPHNVVFKAYLRIDC